MTAAKSYRDMTSDEMLAWGAAEHAARVADLADRTPGGLQRAQDAAEQRRKLAGLTRSQAAALVSDAGRARRREEARSAS